MNILVSTKGTQGQRENDFCFVPERELVRIGYTCIKDRHDIDGPCGCARYLVGVDCRKGTTTVKVVPFDGLREEWKELIRQAYQRAGYGDSFDNEPLLNVAAQYPTGTVLEKRGGDMCLRQYCS